MHFINLINNYGTSRQEENIQIVMGTKDSFKFI